MSVSPGLRFEVLRRDNFTCRYCGASAPDVKLQVDHVVPQSRGGSDAPWNLVAACETCNRGKSATEADKPLLAGPSEEAIRSVRAARDVVDFLWDQLPIPVAPGDDRAQLANRFVEEQVGATYAAWSRELMAFAQAVSDTAQIAVWAQTFGRPTLRLHLTHDQQQEVLDQARKIHWNDNAPPALEEVTVDLTAVDLALGRAVRQLNRAHTGGGA